ncbi:3'-5' exonuclease [Catellatospora sp. NPDC049133]|uniref:3'-5' exonuclease n=1 Tax=Catellatospora sp. NPDC049133 TaxID=3155499 RepID=UPI0034016863
MASRTFGQQDLAGYVGLQVWQLAVALRQGLIPAPKHGRWSQTVADQIVAEFAQVVREAVGDRPPVWAADAALLLAHRTGLDVVRDDVDVLAAVGQIPVATVSNGGYNHYCPAQLDRVPVKAVRQAVDDRRAGAPAAYSTWTAVRSLGWRRAEFDRVVRERRFTTGPGGMWRREDIEALAADAELNAGLDAVRLLGANEAAARLSIRRTDWDLIVAAGWVATAGSFEVESARAGYTHTLRVPGYLAADIDAVLTLPGVDWDAVRAAGKGQRSPLRAHVQAPKRAGDALRSFCRNIQAARGIRAWVVYDPPAERWVLNWTLDPALQPTAEQMGKLLDDDPDLAAHRARVHLLTLRWRTVHWARRMLQPGTAVVLDVETTDLDGSVCEIAIIDAATGSTLLDTLVNPGRPISPEAQWVHGISDQDVADAPTWAQVLPQVLAAIGDRRVLAYNESFDRRMVRADTRRAGADVGVLPGPARWGCIMQARSDWWHYEGRIALDGGHRALGDTEAARQVLLDIANSAPPAE